MHALRSWIALSAAVVTLIVSPVAEAGVRAVAVFPSNLLTVRDHSQPTGLRVNLPKPDCTVYVTDCQNVDVINTLDGFSLLPRVSVRFNGPIDPLTVSSSTVHLYDTSCVFCKPIGIERATWEPAATTLHFEPASFLKEKTTYVIVVTTGVRDAAGRPLERALPGISPSTSLLGNVLSRVAAASIFTTQTPTDDLVTIRRQLDAATPSRATITASFPRAGTTVSFNRQNVAPPGGFTTLQFLTHTLEFFPGSVESIVFGSFSSPQYLDAEGTLPLPPSVKSWETVHFNLFLPSSPEPANGYPVMIFAHGGGPWGKNAGANVFASALAARGIATIAINQVGAGGGPEGTLVVTSPSGTTTLPAGGREVLLPDLSAPILGREGARQTVVDLMQLVRVIRGGGLPHLSRTRVYFLGTSGGAFMGTPLLGVDPLIRAGVLNAVGGDGLETALLSATLRPVYGRALAATIPSLYNADPFAPGVPPFTSFIENFPLRGAPVLVDTVPGASAIQAAHDRTRWVRQGATPETYARQLTRPLIVQFAKGDKLAPNPTTSILLRTGNLAHRATYFRNDLAWAANPLLAKDPHTFANSFQASGALTEHARQAQNQIATFFASDGTVTIDPDGEGPFFETPIAGPLPEELSYIP